MVLLSSLKYVHAYFVARARARTFASSFLINSLYNSRTRKRHMHTHAHMHPSSSLLSSLTQALCNGRICCPWDGACFNIAAGGIEDGIQTYKVRQGRGKREERCERVRWTTSVCVVCVWGGRERGGRGREGREKGEGEKSSSQRNKLSINHIIRWHYEAKTLLWAVQWKPSQTLSAPPMCVHMTTRTRGCFWL